MILSRNTVVPLIRKIVCLVIALKLQTENCVSLLLITTLIRIRIRSFVTSCLSTDGKHQISMSLKYVCTYQCTIEEAVNQFKEPVIALKNISPWTYIPRRCKAKHTLNLKNPQTIDKFLYMRTTTGWLLGQPIPLSFRG